MAIFRKASTPHLMSLAVILGTGHKTTTKKKKKKSKMIPEHLLVPESLKNIHFNDSMSRGSKNKFIEASGDQN